MGDADVPRGVDDGPLIEEEVGEVAVAVERFELGVGRGDGVGHAEGLKTLLEGGADAELASWPTALGVFDVAGQGVHGENEHALSDRE